jgi:hypothetical protein
LEQSRRELVEIVLRSWFFVSCYNRQGTGRDTLSADDFLDTALTWFGDPDPRIELIFLALRDITKSHFLWSDMRRHVRLSSDRYSTAR